MSPSSGTNAGLFIVIAAMLAAYLAIIAYANRDAIRCAFGRHRWLYTPNGERRDCRDCRATQLRRYVVGRDGAEQQWVDRFTHRRRSFWS